jgi:N-acetylglucosaminyldiphosphoundecaprenol N-acetyl-beta-D-mannosaminyltransferase
MQKVDLFNVPIAIPTFEQALDACRRQPSGWVCFVNVHTLTESRTDARLQSALRGAFLALPDGMPLVWSAHAKGARQTQRVCGPDFTAAWAKRYPDEPVGLIGGQPGRAEALAKNLGLRQTTVYSPPMRPFSEANAREDWARFLERCPGGKAPQFVWIGLGAPKQEYWMQAVSAIAPETLFFGVGAAFDFHAGAIDRAPEWMQRSGLEWVHRLSQDPKRLWKRYLVTNTRFVIGMARETIRR